MKVAGILLHDETIGIVNPEGKMSTRDEIMKQGGVRLPSSLEEFLFGGSIQKIKDHFILQIMQES